MSLDHLDFRGLGLSISSISLGITNIVDRFSAFLAPTYAVLVGILTLIISGLTIRYYILKNKEVKKQSKLSELNMKIKQIELERLQKQEP